MKIHHKANIETEEVMKRVKFQSSIGEGFALYSNSKVKAVGRSIARRLQAEYLGAKPVRGGYDVRVRTPWNTFDVRVIF